MKSNPFSFLIILLLIGNIYAGYSQTDSQKQKITSRYNTSLLKQLSSKYLLESKADQKALFQEAKRKNLKLSLQLKDGSYAELQRIDEDGTPLYYKTYNVKASRSTRTDHLNIGGSTGFNLDGQDMTAYVWDGGHPRPSHQEYQSGSAISRVTLKDTVSEGGLDLNFHAGHVTGTLVASGVVPAAKGMAPKAKVDAYKWNSDLAEAAAAAAEGMLVSNHSYGLKSDDLPDYFFGNYINSSRNWDNLQYNAPYYLMVVAGGNDGEETFNDNPIDPNYPQYDKLTGIATSKNNLVVANAQDANVTDDGEFLSVQINPGSSQGPTDDLRIKPDITGNGTGVYSTYANGDSSYNSISGTSMASPNVAGSALLLQQHSQKLFGEFMRSATLKGLILHTADDAGMEGPDAIFGWGLMNTKRASEAMSSKDNGVVINDLSLLPGQTYTLEVKSNDVDALLASISWTDPAGESTNQLNSKTPRLVNDLDIVVEQNGTEHLPWRLTGVNSNEKGNNSADNFERVDIENASGTYTIKITHKGDLENEQQNYTLIVTGLNSEPVVCEATPPTGITVGGLNYESASLYWDNLAGGKYDFRYREKGSTEWLESSVETNSINLDNLSELTTYEVQIRTNCVEENTVSDFSEIVTFKTKEFVLSYCHSEGQNTSDEFIARVRLNEIDNESGAGSGYSDFTNVSTDLVVGKSYTVTVNPGWTGTVYPEGISVWIDFNLNGDFTDDGEQVLAAGPSTSDEVSATFTVPEGAVEGESLRMRVSMKYDGFPSSCESFSYGEVEDYSVVLLPAGSCSIPTPEGKAEQRFCSEPTLADIEVDGESVAWYADEFDEAPLLSDYAISNGEVLYAAKVEGDCESEGRLAVTVNFGDVESPTPTQEVLQNIVAQCEVTELIPPTATDNCDQGQLSAKTKAELPILESREITWEYTDTSGNVSTQTQKIIIEDTEKPEILVKDNITLELGQDGLATLSADDIDGGTTDNCQLEKRELSRVDFSCEDFDQNASTKEVLFTVTDASGNTTEKMVEVTLKNSVSSCSFDKANVVLYPNPTRQELHFESERIQLPVDQYRVFDINGKEVLVLKIDSNDKSIDVSNLPSGNYFLLMSSGNKTLTKRFIKK